MKILIELPSWLGDTIMATPAIENIVNYNNDAELTLIGPSISIEALKNHPNVTKIIPIHKNYILLAKSTMNIGKFDIFFSFRNSIRSNFLKLLIKSKFKYKYSKSKYNNHQVENYNQFINDSIGQQYIAKKLIIHQYNQGAKKSHFKKVGINPGAKFGSSKRWSTSEFSKVAIELSNDYDILIFGSSDEKVIANEIEQLLITGQVKNYKNLAGKTSIQELISIISSLDLFITGDSGPMHIAAVFKVPTVSIFGPTNDKHTSQFGFNKSIIVKKDLNCQPCMQRTCPLKHNNCMKLIKASEVLKAIQLLN